MKILKKKALPFFLVVLIFIQSVYGFCTTTYAAEPNDDEIQLEPMDQELTEVAIEESTEETADTESADSVSTEIMPEDPNQIPDGTNDTEEKLSTEESSAEENLDVLEEETVETLTESEVAPEDQVVYDGGLSWMNDIPNAKLEEIFGMSKSEVSSYLNEVWSHTEIEPSTVSMGAGSLYARMQRSMLLRAMNASISDEGEANLTHGEFFDGPFGYRTTYFYVNVSGNNSDAYCIDPTLSTPPTATYGYFINEGGAPGTATYAAASILYQYDYNNSGFREMWNASMDEASVPDTDRNLFNLDDSKSAYFFVHSLVANCWHAGAIWDGDTEGAYHVAGHSEFKAAFGIMYTKVLLANHPSNYKVYYLNTGSSYQNIIFSNYVPKGKIEIEKKPAQETIYNAHKDQYSMDGAVYGIYSSEANAQSDTNRIQSLRIVNGKATSRDLDVGTYYIKEVESPEAYYLDPTIYTVEVESSATVKVTSTENMEFARVRVLKSSLNEDYTSDNDVYSLAGAEYQVYTDAACTTPATAYTYDESRKLATDTVQALMITEGDGKSNILTLARDTYYIKETKSSPGFEKDTAVKTVDLRHAVYRDVELVPSKEPDNPPTLTLMKQSSNPEVTGQNSNYSLSGAKYQVYTDEACQNPARALILNADGEIVNYVNAELTTTADGSSNTLTMERKLYYVKEVQPSNGFLLDTKVYEADLRYYTSDNPYLIVSIEPADTPKVSVQKVSGRAEMTDGNCIYSLAGATYQVYTDAACTKKAKAYMVNAMGEITGETEALLTTHEDGSANVLRLARGIYYVKETKSSPGYRLDRTVYQIDVRLYNSSTPYTFESKEIPVGDPTRVALSKQDAEGIAMIKHGNEVTPITEFGGSTLAGAVFRIDFYDDYFDRETVSSGTPAATWYIETKYDSDWNQFIATLDGDHLAAGYTSSPFYRSIDGNIYFPLGTVTIKEEKAPEGYKKATDGGVWIDASGLVDSCVSVTQIRPLDRDGDGSDDIAALFYEDEHSQTMTNGAGTIIKVFNLRDDAEMLSVSDQIYRGDFSFTKKSYETLELMPYCFFKVTASTGESHIIVTNANGYYSSKTGTHSANTNAYDDLYEEIYATYYNADGSLKDGVDLAFATRDVKNKVNALGEVGLWFYGSSDTAEWDDTKINDDKGACRYDDSYVLEELPCPIASLMETQVIEPVPVSITEDLGIQALGTITDMPVIQIRTQEWDEDTESHYSVEEDGKVNAIKDTVVCQYLKPHTTYTLKGILIQTDDSGNNLGPLLDANGDQIQAVTTFTSGDAELVASSQSARAVETMHFTFDGSDLNGVKFVILEYLYEGRDSTSLICDEDGNVDASGAIASHDDLTDEKQTGMFVGLGTTAFMTDDHSTIVKLSKNMKISDLCEYSYFPIGIPVTVTGELVYQTEDGEVHPILDKDGNPVTASKTFTPDTPDGMLTIDFPEIDGTQLLDQSGKLLAGGIVCYETMDVSGYFTVKRNDITDQNETIRTLEFHTTASDSKTGTHQAKAEKEVTLYDDVPYQGLIIGKTYEVVGTAYDKNTGKGLLDADGNKITSSVTFTADHINGTAHLAFTFDGSNLKGKTLVFFEELYEEDLLIGVHADLSDEDQTIYFPEIGTKMLTQKGDSIVIPAEDSLITPTDTVAYHNLIVGKKYRITGTLMNKATKKPVLYNGEPITEMVIFEPKSKDGSIEVTFPTFDIHDTDLLASDYMFHDIVCFESLAIETDSNFKEVEEHTDFEDQDQTLTLKNRARVQVLKTGPFLTGTSTFAVTMRDGKKQTVHRMEYEEKPFAGITFTVFDKKTNEEVTSFVSDADGMAVSDLIPYGNGEEYYVKETGTPAGLVQSDEVYPVEFSMYDGESLCFVNPEIDIENTATGVELNVYKNGEFLIPNTTDGYGIAQKGIEGVYFGIYTDEDIKDHKGKVVVKKDTLVSILKTNEVGLAQAVESLVAGKYYYQELQTASEEYALDESMYPFEIIYKENNTEPILRYELNYASPLLNTYKSQDVELLKVDETGKAIPGVTFALYRKYQDHYIQIGSYKTGKDGKIVLTNVPFGKYYFQEIKGVAGYDFDGETHYEFEINDESIKNGEIIRITAVNHSTVIRTGDMGAPSLALALMLLSSLIGSIMGILYVFQVREKQPFITITAMTTVGCIDLYAFEMIMDTGYWIWYALPIFVFGITLGVLIFRHRKRSV